MVEYLRATGRTFSNWKSVIIGTILSLIPILNFAVYGFALELARKKLRSEDEMPSWKPFLKRWGEGILAFLVYLVYLLPAIVVGLVSVFRGRTSLLNGLFLAFIVIASYLLPAGLACVARGSWKSAFSGDLFRAAFSLRYFISWVLASILVMFIAVILGSISSLLAFTIVVPKILYIGLLPYVTIILIISCISEALQKPRAVSKGDKIDEKIEEMERRIAAMRYV